MRRIPTIILLNLMIENHVKIIFRFGLNLEASQRLPSYIPIPNGEKIFYLKEAVFAMRYVSDCMGCKMLKPAIMGLIEWFLI